jgi:hypothetical protein
MPVEVPSGPSLHRFYISVILLQQCVLNRVVDPVLVLPKIADVYVLKISFNCYSFALCYLKEKCRTCGLSDLLSGPLPQFEIL